MKAIIVLLVSVAPSLAYANAGIPMLALAWPAQWLALIPIIVLEGELIRRSLKIPFNQMIWPVTKANFVSTLVGVPVAWVAMLAPLMLVSYGYNLASPGEEIPDMVQYLLFPLTAAWVGGNSVWQPYFAFLILAIPFCLISIFLEKASLRRSFPKQTKAKLYPLVVCANIWSYVALSALAILFPILI